jgi:ribose 5-phosphate isomerase B
MKIYFGSDHAGFILKTLLIDYLEKNTDYEVADVFCLNCEKCDYPDGAEEVCKNVLENEDSIGILICGTGIGMSVAANKIKGIICALCSDTYSAEKAKNHNNANVLALAGRILDSVNAINIMNAFLESKYEYGRHNQRLLKVRKIEFNPKNYYIKSKKTFL